MLIVEIHAGTAAKRHAVPIGAGESAPDVRQGALRRAPGEVRHVAVFFQGGTRRASLWGVATPRTTHRFGVDALVMKRTRSGQCYSPVGVSGCTRDEAFCEDVQAVAHPAHAPSDTERSASEARPRKQPQGHREPLYPPTDRVGRRILAQVRVPPHSYCVAHSATPSKAVSYASK
jgi:hypothetical protein